MFSWRGASLSKEYGFIACTKLSTGTNLLYVTLIYFYFAIFKTDILKLALFD